MFRQQLYSVVVLVSFLAACAHGEAGNPLNEAEPMGLPAIGPTLTGSYLAGRQAQASQRLDLAVEHLTQALEFDPDNIDILRRAFLVATAEGRMDQALELARRLIETDSSGPMPHFALVTDDMRQGRFAEAAARLDNLPESGINIFMAPLLKAWALAGQGKGEAAIKALDPLVENEGFLPLRNLHAALINDLFGNVEAANRDFLATLEDQTEPTLRLVVLAGNFLERRGQTDVARGLYQEYSKKSAGSPRLLLPSLERLDKGMVPEPDVGQAAHGAAEAMFGIASSLRQQNARDTALAFSRLALHLKPDFPVVRMLIAGILETDDRRDAANAIYAEIGRDSSFHWAARQRMASNLDALGETDAAVAMLKSMATEDPNDVDSLIDLGDILRSSERFEEAVQAYDQAISRIGEIGEQHWSLLYSRGIALERSKQWDRAEADFLKALEFRPDQPYLLNYLGYTWVEKGMHLERAQEMIKKAVSLRPRDGYIVDSLGWVYFQLGNYPDAVKELERAVELRPDDPVINDHLGDAYWKVGRLREARFQWKRSLGLNPTEELAPLLEKKLKEGLAETEKTGGNG